MQPNWFVAIKAIPCRALEFPPVDDGMRLIHPDDYHITIAFLGTCADDPTETLAPMLQQIQQQRLTTEAIEALLLPRQQWASVVALGFDDSTGELRSLIGRWRDRIRQRLGLEPERRSILPHLTIARMKPSRTLAQQRLQWAKQLEQHLPVPFELTTIGLYTWNEHALPSEPRYRMTVSVDLF